VIDRVFFDSNVLLYMLSEDRDKADHAEILLAGGGTISVQVLNELTLAGRRKFGLDWVGIDQFLMLVRAQCVIRPMTEDTCDLGRKLAERYQLPVYDAMIVAAALLADVDTLYSEDMHDGLLVEGRLRIRNPFLARSVQET
jgi:predicted nucleic acid-binding protein